MRGQPAKYTGAVKATQLWDGSATANQLRPFICVCVHAVGGGSYSARRVIVWRKGRILFLVLFLFAFSSFLLWAIQQQS